MDFNFFKSLTKEEAQKYLEDFLEFGKKQGLEALKENIDFTVDLNFSIGSLSPLFKRLIPLLKTVPMKSDLSVPEFIRSTDSYKKTLFEFAEPSKYILLVTAYYFGETFVKNYESLYWATGNPNYIQENMPVITGFKHNELPVILVSENMFTKIISGMAADSSIDVTVEIWKSNAEQS